MAATQEPEHVRIDVPFFVCDGCGTRERFICADRPPSVIWNDFVDDHAMCTDAAASEQEAWDIAI